MGIYVEILICGTPDELWHKTQTPDVHQHWDLRFSDITYLPGPDGHQPQRFRYRTRLGGLQITGYGETVGQRNTTHGDTPAFSFWSDDPRSLIRRGSGIGSIVQKVMVFASVPGMIIKPVWGSLVGSLTASSSAH